MNGHRVSVLNLFNKNLEQYHRDSIIFQRPPKSMPKNPHPTPTTAFNLIKKNMHLHLITRTIVILADIC